MDYPENVILIYLSNEGIRDEDERVVLCERQLFENNKLKKILKIVFPELFKGWFSKKPIKSFMIVPQKIDCPTFKDGIPSYFDSFVIRAIEEGGEYSNDWEECPIITFTMSKDNDGKRWIYTYSFTKEELTT